MKKPSCSSFRKTPSLFFLSVLMILAFSKPASAQCEGPPGISLITQASVAGMEQATLTAMNAAILAANSATTFAATTQLMGIPVPGTTPSGTPALSLQMMEDEILGQMNWFWEQWLAALKDMTKQLHSGIIDQTRQIGSNMDASSLTRTVLETQKEEMQAKKNYQTTDQACQFDTTARYMGRTNEIADGATTGYALDFSRVGNNEANTPSASSAAGLSRTRFDTYRTRFCDNTADNGNAGCTAATPSPNMHIMPSRTIFAKETIDMADPDTRSAVTELLFNITGYEVGDPLLTTAQTSAIGLEQRQENREYLAQMDAVAALAASVVAERIPGGPAPEIRAMRQRLGVTDASETPSAREIRQAVIEQLWEPKYYQDLYDSPATIPQKEVYLKAYSLAMLYEMIAKQEKISNVYAIETANMLDRANKSRHNVSSSAPLQ